MASEDSTSTVRPDPTQEPWTRRHHNKLVYGGSFSGVAAIAGLIYFFFFAAVVYKTVEQAVTAIAKEHPDARINMDRASGFVASLSNLAASTISATPVAREAAADYALEFVQDPAVAKALGVPEEARLTAPRQRIQVDAQIPDYDIVRIEQFINSVRLFGADIAVSVRSGPSAAIDAVNTRPAPVPDIDLTPTVDPSRARAVAAAIYTSLAAEPERRFVQGAESDAPELVVFDPSRFGLDGRAALAWRVRQSTLEVFVDAKTAQVILSYDDRPTALDRRTHDCQLTFNCQLILENEKPVPRGTKVSADAKNAHDFVLHAHAYFKGTHKRDGYDDATGSGGKAPIATYVQVRNFDNAQWNPTRQRFDFGLGWATLDIAAHEYTHAVTTFGPNIRYLGQAGAVNEFFSDFFGVLIQRSVTKQMDWAIGEGLPGRTAAKPLRSMATPHNGGFNRDAAYQSGTNSGQPEHFDELVTPRHKICGSLPAGGPDGLPDNGCVHFNSGILNKAFYLVLSGDTFNGTRVTAVTPGKIEQIVFRTLMYSTSSANILDTANGAVTACRDLLGAAQYDIQTADCTALRNAFVAVKIPVAP